MDKYNKPYRVYFHEEGSNPPAYHVIIRAYNINQAIRQGELLVSLISSGDYPLETTTKRCCVTKEAIAYITSKLKKPVMSDIILEET